MGNTIFSPDTCDCVVEYSSVIIDGDGDLEFVRMINACALHGKNKDKNTYKKMLSHNRSFNMKYGDTPSDKQVIEIINDKRLEKERIKNLKND